MSGVEEQQAAEELAAVLLDLVAGRIRTEQARTLAGVVRFAHGIDSEEDLKRVRSLLRAWLSGEAEDSLEHALGMVMTSVQRRNALRDLWLRRAMARVVPGATRPVVIELEAVWTRFVSRGPWSRWRALAVPPPEASEIETALFWLTRFNDGDTFTRRHIYRLIGSVATCTTCPVGTLIEAPQLEEAGNGR